MEPPIYPSKEIVYRTKHYFYFIIIISGEISFVIVVVVVAVAPTEMPHFGLGFPFPPRFHRDFAELG